MHVKVYLHDSQRQQCRVKESHKVKELERCIQTHGELLEMEETFRIEQVNCGYLVSPGKVTFDMEASAKLSVVKHLTNTL